MSAPERAAVAALLREAFTLHQQGRMEDAERLYRQVLKAEPENAGALHYLGVFMAQAGKPSEAAELIGRAILADPSDVTAFYNHGTVLRELKRLEEAVGSYDSALRLSPDHVGALTNRGATLEALKRPEEALASYERALALEPGSPHIAFNKANALRDLGRLQEALSAYDRLLQLHPGFAPALNNRANVLSRLLRFELALADYTRAVALEPANADALCNRGHLLLQMERIPDAIQAFTQALAVRPELAWALLGRGNAFVSVGDHTQAIADYEAAFRLAPDLDYLEGRRLHTKMLICDWEGIDAALPELLAHVREGRRACEPFPLLAVSSSPAEQLRCAEVFAAARHPPARAPLWRGERYRHQRIRVAYVSGEFREAATAYLTADLFECHDRTALETYGISTGPNAPNAMQRRLEGAFDQFLDATSMTDAEIGTFLRRNEIDILVNLNGYFGFDRTQVFAMRPVPVQVNFLGFPGTMGAPYMDYIVADRHLIPEEEREFYSEQIMYMPESYQPNDRKRPTADRAVSRSECGLPDNGFVFCCFNNNHKVTPQFFDIWMRLLTAVPGSVLWLFEGNPAVKRNLHREAEARGVAADRIVFARSVMLADHLAREKLADLFLDTLPHNAHTTASDALWCGVPVVTCRGSTFAGRVAVSLLTTVGLPELITETAAEYEALALRLTSNPALLGRVKEKLLRNRDACPLFDTRRYTRYLEQGYRIMWERAERGLPPASFAVEHSLP
jgi:predicted O-linked N-acetylglucosamine transferase (SPINDLY family)